MALPFPFAVFDASLSTLTSGTGDFFCSALSLLLLVVISLNGVLNGGRNGLLKAEDPAKSDEVAVELTYLLLPCASGW